MFSPIEKISIFAVYKQHRLLQLLIIKITTMKKILLWQLSALGIEFGGAQLRGYIEGGFGTQGFALVGIRYKF